MQTLGQIKRLLEERGLRPSKALGQNFLCDHNLIRRLVDAAAVGDGDVVLEIGPGTGALTEELLERGCRVVACELDRGLADLLRERFGGATDGRFVLIEGDCLAGKHALNPAIIGALGGRAFKLVANLPYGAASPLMVTLATEHPPKPRASDAKPACLGQFVTIQREVAERLRAGPGSKDYGELGVLVQAMCEVRRLAVLPPGCFWPQPKVTSEMVAISPRAQALTGDPARLSEVCRLLFTQRRKQLGSILARAGLDEGLTLPEGVERTMRPEQLTIERLVALGRLLDRG